MRGSRWVICLWPGLAPLWMHGRWCGFAQATGFSILVNSLLVATIVWPELVPPTVRSLGWTTVLGLWCWGAVASRRWLAKQAQTPHEMAADASGVVAIEGGDLYPQAIREYLRGNWFEAEMLCNRLLWQDARDVEAHLLMATVLRRSRRFADAQERLDELERLDAAANWQREISVERELLKVAGQEESAHVGAKMPSAA